MDACTNFFVNFLLLVLFFWGQRLARISWGDFCNPSLKYLKRAGTVFTSASGNEVLAYRWTGIFRDCHGYIHTENFTNSVVYGYVRLCESFAGQGQ